MSGAGGREAARARALGAHLPPLLVAAERIAATVAQGVHGRRRVGQGDSFWQFRALLPGEPASRIDWRRSARAERSHFVRQTEWEAAQTVALWRQAGPGMSWRSRADLPTKQERAELLLLALAALLLRGGERVRLLAARSLDAAAEASLGRLAAELASPGEAANETPDAAAVPRHAGVVLLGDFLAPPEQLRATIGALAARGARGQVVQVLDPAEVVLPYTGRIRFTAPAPSGPTALIGRVEATRDLYAQRLAEQQAGLAAICRAAGLGVITHRTDHPPATALLALHAALAPPRLRA